jgi:hypothetical protein
MKVYKEYSRNPKKPVKVVRRVVRRVDEKYPYLPKITLPIPEWEYKKFRFLKLNISGQYIEWIILQCRTRLNTI